MPGIRSISFAKTSGAPLAMGLSLVAALCLALGGIISHQRSTNDTATSESRRAPMAASLAPEEQFPGAGDREIVPVVVPVNTIPNR
jgi:hypothetical protein